MSTENRLGSTEPERIARSSWSDDAAYGPEFARGQQRALELIATGAPLRDVLDFIVLTIEAHAPGMRGSVLVLPDGVHIRHGSAPNLPPAYIALIDGIPIGPTTGSCGTAMWHDKRVIVADIATDPLWEGYREAALPFGLRACWSTPLHAGTGRVIGSFAMYYDEAREPTPRDLGMADAASHLSGIAVESAWAADQLRRRAGEQAAVATLGQRALLGGDDQELMQALADTVSETLGNVRVGLFEGRTHGQLHLRAAAGWPVGWEPEPTGVAVEVPGGDRPWGMLSVAPRAALGPAAAGERPEEEMAFLRSLVNVLAAAIERTRREQQIRHQALHDPLTGLPNRALLMNLLEHALERGRRTGGTVAVLLLDLDNFKLINDGLGHAAGDEVLAALAPRLRDVVREVDTVARFGGDEFVVVAEDLEDDLEAIGVAGRLTAELTRPFVISDGAHSVTASIGVAVAHAGRGAPDALLRDADAAMYRAKETGGAGHQVFDAGMRRRAVSRLRVVNALRAAIELREFGLAYQPIISTATGTAAGAEALLRWNGRLGPSIGPAELIAAAEESGLIRPIGAWVLAQAIERAVGWPTSGTTPWLSVNVSSRQLASSQFVPLVAQLLADLRLRPERLMLEITETALANDGNDAVATIAALAEMGVRLALDDFGTGLSPLHHLLRFPIHALKVDRSFIAPLPGSAHARAIVAAVTTMAHELGKVVIAEGVETDEQLATVTELGCDFAQGYLLGRPGTEPELLARLNV